MDYWRNGPPPNDDDVLAQITRLKAAAWRKMKPVILAYFEETEGRLVQTRMEAERAKAVEHRARASQKAQKAANARWHEKPEQADAPSIAQAMPDELLEVCPPPSPASLSKDKGGKPPEFHEKVMFDSGLALLTAGGSSTASARSLNWQVA